MPRATYKIFDFSGGMNDEGDPRDIQDNQFVKCDGWDVTERGIIKL